MYSYDCFVMTLQCKYLFCNDYHFVGLDEGSDGGAMIGGIVGGIIVGIGGGVIGGVILLCILTWFTLCIFNGITRLCMSSDIPQLYRISSTSVSQQQPQHSYVDHQTPPSTPELSDPTITEPAPPP